MEKAKTKNAIDMVNGPVFGKILRFAIPLMLSTVLQILFNAADVIVVGRYGSENSLAAVGSTTAIINLLVNLFLGLSIGANVLTAHNIGAKRDRDVHDVVHTAMKSSIYIGMILAAAGLILSPQLLMLMSAPQEIIGLASVYMRIIFLGMPAMMMYNFGSSILRAIGDTRRPLLYLSIAGILNVALNLFFVIVCRMDVAGVALATIISQYLSAFLTVRCLCRENSVIRLVLREMKINRDVFRRMIRIGLPAGIQGCVFSISNVVVQSYVNSFGAVVVAGNAAALNYEYTLYAITTSFSQAVMSFSSQNMGAGKFNRLSRIYISGLISSVIVVFAVSVLMCIFARPLVGIFSTSKEIIDAGVARVLICERLYVLYALFDVTVGILRGIGYAILPMAVSIGGICAFRIAWLAIAFSMPQFHTQTVLYAAYPLSWFVAFAILFVCLLVIMRKLGKRYREA